MPASGPIAAHRFNPRYCRKFFRQDGAGLATMTDGRSDDPAQVPPPLGKRLRTPLAHAEPELTALPEITILSRMVATTPTAPTFRYRFLVGSRVVHQGITTDLKRREREHRRRWPGGRIEAVGEPTSHADAWDWERQQASGG